MREMINTYTSQEQKNIELVKEYVQIAYDPMNQTTRIADAALAYHTRAV